MADLNTTVGFTYSGTGLKQAEADLRKVAQTSKTTVQSMQQTSTAAGRLGSAFKGMGPGIQNASFQLQDIIVQMQMGVPVSRTLGQQLPQLLGGFGPLGAVLGVVAGGMASLIPLMFSLSDETDNASSSVKTFSEVLKEGSEKIAEMEKELTMLRKGFRSTFEVELVGQVTNATLAVEKAREKLERLRELQSRSTFRTGDVEDTTTFVQEAEEDLRKAEEQLARYRKLFDEIQNERERQKLRDKNTRLLPALDPIRSEREGFGRVGSESIEAANRRIKERIKYEEEAQKLQKRLYDKDVEEFRKAQAEKQKYADQAANSISSGFENAFTSIVNGTMSVSDAFRNMAASILNDLAKIVVRQSITDPLGKALSGIIGSFNFGSFFQPTGPGLGTRGLSSSTISNLYPSLGYKPRALGGPVMSGSPYIVGERGPELFVPKASGSIVPNNAMGGQTVNINIVNENGGQVETQQNGPDIDVIIRRSVAADIAGGGSTFQAIRKTFELTPALNRRG